MGGPTLIDTSFRAHANVTITCILSGVSTSPISPSIWTTRTFVTAPVDLLPYHIKIMRLEPATNQAERRWIIRTREKEIE
jgi:hypothetical protein